MNEKINDKLNMNNKLKKMSQIITYKPIKIYGKDYYSKKEYSFYLNINTIFKVLEDSSEICITDIIDKIYINWDQILENCFQKIDNITKDKIEEIFNKVRKNKNILEMILDESHEIKEIIELEEIRCNDPKIFKNILILKKEIDIYKKIQEYLNDNVISNTEEYLLFKNDRSLTSKFKDIKNFYNKFLSKCKDYKCYQLKIDGGKNIEFKLRMNDIRNITKQQTKCNIEEIISENPFIINIVTDKKEIANICHLKKKIKSKMDEINDYLNLKYDNFHQKIFTLIQEIIWEKLYETFDHLIIFSNNDDNLKKYFNISEDVYVSHPYASTIHKSQGQTFSDVYVDVNNILNTKQHFIIKKRLLYTSITRCSKDLYLNIGY